MRSSGRVRFIQLSRPGCAWGYGNVDGLEANMVEGGGVHGDQMEREYRSIRRGESLTWVG